MILAAAVLLLLAPPVLATPAAPGDPAAAAGDPPAAAGEPGTATGNPAAASGVPGVAAGDPPAITLFAQGHLYPRYIADPTRPVFGALNMAFEHTDIDDTSRRRYGLKAGGSFVLLEWLYDRDPDHGLQLVFAGGINAQFDADQSQDAIGWDGLYGVHLAWRPHARLAFRAGINHVSAHLGDEIIERTGRRRVNYTRGERQAGLAVFLRQDLRGYVDAGYAYDRRNGWVQKEGRGQVGLEYENLALFRSVGSGVFAAVDVSGYEENAWRRNLTLQGGLVVARDERRLRLGLEYYDGRAQLGEYAQDREEYISLAVWLDL